MGNKTARDFFWFYFSSIFLRKLLGKIPGLRILMTTPHIITFFSGFNRPKRLLVFINPVGGRKLGRKIYMEQVQPLFELANIKVDIIGE